jgi:NADPH:quinone reductase-like Zn-dependent oxidoreductase
MLALRASPPSISSTGAGAGSPGSPSLPFTLGEDVAGRVDKLGQGVSSLELGQSHVFTSPQHLVDVTVPVPRYGAKP